MVDSLGESSLSCMLEAMTTAEKEMAAQASSYQYMLHRKNRDKHVRAMAKRYLVSKKNPQVALHSLRETLTFYKEHELEDLRLGRKNLQELRRSLALKDVRVQGYDRQGRALWIGDPQKTCSFEETSYIRDAIYTMERALACSEASSGEEQITAVIDYAGYQPLRHNPPFHLSVKLLKILRKHYVGRLNRIYLLDAPWSLRTLWKLLKNFAGRETRQKLIFVTGPKEKELVLRGILDPSQVPTWMLPKGEVEWEDEMDLDRYLHRIPFDETYQPKVASPVGPTSQKENFAHMSVTDGT